MRIGVHGTAVRMRDRLDYKRVMKSRVEDLRRREIKMLLSEEERDWMKDHGIRSEPVTGMNGVECTRRQTAIWSRC